MLAKHLSPNVPWIATISGYAQGKNPEKGRFPVSGIGLLGGLPPEFPFPLLPEGGRRGTKGDEGLGAETL
jgi:hypothetical protein